jgi:hypothetical protein
MAFSLSDYLPDQAVGGLEGLGKILQNPMVLQYMAGIGKGLSKGNNVFGEVAGDLTEQNVKASQNLKFLQKVLGAGGKLNVDGEKTSLHIPTSGLFGGAPGATEAAGASSEMPAPGVNTSGTSALSGGATSNPNPSQGSLDYLSSLADIGSFNPAGLTPEDIRGAMSIRLAQDDLMRKKVQDVATNAYHMETAKITKMLREAQLDKISREKPETTNDIKEYEYAKQQGYSGDFKTWQQMRKDEGTTADFKNYQEAVKQGFKGTLFDYQEKLASARRPSVGEVEAKAGASTTGHNIAEHEKYPDSESLAKDIANFSKDRKSLRPYIEKYMEVDPNLSELNARRMAMIARYTELLEADEWKLVGQPIPQPGGRVLYNLYSPKTGKVRSKVYVIN